MNTFCSGLFILIISFIVFSPISNAQAPTAFSYQGIARNGGGQPLSNQSISLRISIVKGSATGIIPYQELHSVMTSDRGIFSIRIGEGQVLVGDMSDINWADDSFYIRTEMDAEGGQDYVDIGVSQLYSVPYALYAQKAGNNTDSDPFNEIQSLILTGNVLEISGGNSVVLPNGSGIDSDSEIWKEEENGIFYEGGGTINYKVDSINKVSIGNDANQGILIIRNDEGNISSYGVTLDDGSGAVGVDGPNESPNVVMWSNSVNPNNGLISIFDENSNLKASILASASKAGHIYTLGENGNNNVLISNLEDNPNHGFLAVRNEDGNTRFGAYSTSEGIGRAYTRGPNGNTNILLTNLSGNSNNGFLAIRDDEGDTKSGVYVGSDGVGKVFTDGPNGELNTFIGSVDNQTNHGSISVYDDSGSTKAGMYVDLNRNGRIFADFVDNLVDNPEKAGEKIVYTMLQGPESAAYLRGTASMVNGEGEVTFPKHFAKSIVGSQMTVMITPLSADSKGVAVVSKGRDGFKVKELLKGTGNYDFDWEVKGVRQKSLKKSKIQPIHTTKEMEAAVDGKPQKAEPDRIERVNHH